MADVLGRLFFLLSSGIWNLVTGVMLLTQGIVNEISVFADEISSVVYRDAPETVMMLLAIGVAVGIFAVPKGQKLRGYGRMVAKRAAIAALVVACSVVLITASNLDYQRGADTPAQAAGSPSWMITKLTDWGEPVVEPLVESSADILALKSDSELQGQGVVDCRQWSNRLTSHAQQSEEVPVAAVSASRIWERMYYSIWADTAYGDAANEVSCVAGEWRAGFDAWQVRIIACMTQSNDPKLERLVPGVPSALGCEWADDDVLPEEPASNKHLVWAPPSDRRLEGRLLAPFFLCDYNQGKGMWERNREAAIWEETPTYTDSISFQPEVVSEACAAWWSAEVLDVPDCSKQGKYLLCDSEFPRVVFDPEELTEDIEDLIEDETDAPADSDENTENAEDLAEIEGLAEIVSATTANEVDNLGVRLEYRHDAAMTHEIWNDLPSPKTTSDATIKAFSGEHENLLVSGSMALANSLTYGLMVLLSSLLVLGGGVLLVGAGALLPLSLLGLSMEYKPREIATKAVNLAKTGILLSIGGYALVGMLNLMVFYMVQIVDENPDSSSSRLFYFVSGLASVFLLSRLYKAWKEKRGTGDSGAPAGGGLMPDLRSRWVGTDTQIRQGNKQGRKEYREGKGEAKEEYQEAKSERRQTRSVNKELRKTKIPRQQGASAPPPAAKPGGAAPPQTPSAT